MNNNKKNVIFLMGPTASNKTKLAIKLSKFLPIDLISVDSGLVYKELEIGTAKPTKEELKFAPHSLINIRSINEYYSAENFKKDALFEIKKSFSNKRIPVLVGGTMFYYNSLLNGLSPLPARNDNLRKILLKKFFFNSKNNLHKKLISIDPISAFRIHPNDSQRILRALEIYYLSKKKMSDLIKFKNYKFPYNSLKFIISPKNKNILHRKIEHRFEKMLFLGFQKEVENLILKNYFNKNSPGMNCLGYKEMYDYIFGNINYKKMFFKTILSTKRLAKNQMKWLVNYKDAFWIDSEKLKFSINFILNKIEKFF